MTRYRRRHTTSTRRRHTSKPDRDASKLARTGRIGQRARRRVALLLVVGILGSLLGVKISYAKEDSLPPPPLLWLPSQLRIVDRDAKHGEQLATPLRELGFGVQVFDVETPTSGDAFDGVWWITNEAAQTFPATRARSILNKQGRILLDGLSPLSEDVVGARPTGDTRRYATMGNTFVTWDADIPVVVIEPKPEDHNLATTSERSGGLATPKVPQYPALVRRQSLLWSMPRLDEGAQLRRLPYLNDALRSLGVEPTMERRDIELYVDPDLEYPNTPDELAEKWRSGGVRRVHVAAWKEDRISGYRFDYTGFLTAMHARGIEVFAWVGWPHVNASFFRQHPACREITATGKPAHIFWRDNVALEDPACFDQAWAETSELLNSAEFDGVNLAELYFENPEGGPKNPSAYTPFHPVARAEFQTKGGFDPIEIVDPSSPRYWERDRVSFDSWVEWRTAKARELHEKLLAKVRTLTRIRNTTVTIIDDRYIAQKNKPSANGITLARNIGADSKKILAPMRGTSADIQIEDASELWGADPRRYRQFARLYPDIARSALVIDLNVVDRGGQLPADITTKRARGFELAASVAAIGSTGGRLAMYASSTIADADFPWIKFSLAAGSSHVEEVAAGTVHTRSSVAFRIRVIRPAHRVVMDGKLVRYPGIRSIPVPAGNHIVEFDPPRTR
jgi:hypothetical protein